MKNINFKLPVSILREGKKYVAYTPALDLSTSADNYEDVKKRFEEIVDIFFEEVVKNNTLEQVLNDLGWSHIKKEWRPPVVISQDFQRIEVLV